MAEDRAEPEVPADAVGRRVSCGGERATVRYVGPVPPTSGCFQMIFQHIFFYRKRDLFDDSFVSQLLYCNIPCSDVNRSFKY